MAVVLTASARASAEDAAELPATITFATTTGYWEDNGDPAKGVQAGDPSTPAPEPQPRHGFYKLYAVRQPDHTAKVYLQQILLRDDGPQVISTTELRDITAMKSYITDIRPESSDGLIREPGLFATVLLKRQPDADIESWHVLIDELGEIAVEKAED